MAPFFTGIARGIGGFAFGVRKLISSILFVPPYLTATGGTIVNYTLDGKSYTAHIFTSSGTFSVTNITDSLDGYVDVLVVGGGGSGGVDNGGGGGAGGLIYKTNVSVSNGSGFNIIVGAGGAARPGSSDDGPGNNGSNSLFGLLTAYGGGAGSGWVNTTLPPGSIAYTGGSGAGQSASTGSPNALGAGVGNRVTGKNILSAVLQGNNGGSAVAAYAGGGGGAGGPGGNASSGAAGSGGAGFSNGISGTQAIYAAGGAGGWDIISGFSSVLPFTQNGTVKKTTQTAEDPCPPNTGHGGNGGNTNNNSSGAGGSGIVIVRYAASRPSVSSIITNNLFLNLDAGNSNSYSPPLSDAYANSLVLAIPMNGANNGTTFTDESAIIKGSGSAISITRNGDTKTVNTQSKFYGSSGFFDGTGDYLELDPSRPVVNNLDSWMLSSGSKIGTFECWVYPTAIKTPTNNYDHTSVYNRGTTYINWGIRPGGTVRFYWYQDAQTFVDSTVTIPLNQWSHIAVTIDGSTLRHWINGVSAGSASYSFMTQDVGSNAGVRTIGVAFAQPDGQFTGYLQDFRIYNGVAKYTANFTPPSITSGVTVAAASGALPILNTADLYGTVLGGGGTNWIDISDGTGALPIYNTLDIYGVGKGTGTRTDAYRNSLVLAVPMDGANNGTTFTDESANIRGSGSAKTITRNGDTKTLTAVSKFYGSSGFFDGTGDYLNLGTSSDYLFGTGDFTIEGWFYLTSDSTRQDLMGNYTDANTGWAIQTSFGVAGQIGFYYGNTIILDSAARVWSPNSWTHFAITRSGTSLKLFVNGVNTTTTTNSTNISTTSYNTLLGAVTSFGSGSPQLFCTGYLQDFRIYKGVAKYTSNFKPAGIPSNATLVNGPTYTNLNGGAIVFDGTNDYTQLTSQNLKSVDFSVEVWFYATKALSSTQILYTSYNLPGGAQANTLVFAISSSGKINADNGLGGGPLGTTTISTNTWYHAVVTYTASNTTLRLYLNGNFEASGVAAVTSGASSDFIGGSSGDNNLGTAWFGGSIPVVRVYRGKVISAAEILQNYNLVAGRYGLSTIPSIVTSGLVLNLDAGDADSYPGSGTTWKDVGGILLSSATGAFPIYNTTDNGAFKNDGTRTDTNAIPVGDAGYQNVTGVGNAPANLFDRSVTSYTASGANESLTWTGDINLGTGKYYAIVIAWGQGNQGPGSVTLTVGGVNYTTDYGTLRGTNTDILGQTIGQGGTPSGEQRRSNLTPLGSGTLTSVVLSPTGGNFTNIFYAIVFVPNGVSDTDFANHVVVNNIVNSSLVLAIPMNGANNGTTFTDESANIKGSGSAKTITPTSAITSTTQSKFYGSSGFFNGSSYISIPTSTDLDFAGDFTVEFWYYRTGAGGPDWQSLFQTQNWGNTGINIIWNSGPSTINCSVRNTAVISTSYVIPLNTWQHYAVTRSSNLCRFYINGSLIGSNTISGTTTSQNVNIGYGFNVAGINYSQGYYQDVRLYGGFAKYTANFTPPTQNNGTLTNGPTYSSANGGSIVLDGTNDKVVVPYKSSLNPSNLTLSSWFKRTSAGVYSHPANLPVANGSWGPPYITYGFEFTASTDEIAFTLSFTDNNLSYTTAPASAALAVGSWVNVVGTYDGSFRKIYVNGQLITSVAETRTIRTTNTDFILGAENRDQNSYMLNGSIAQTLVYNRALTATEIQQNYNSLAGRYGLPSVGGSAGITATGGTIVNYTVGGGISYRAHIFTSSGTFSVSSVTGTGSVEYIVVAGGGSGASNNGGGAGGGGAGGYRSSVTGELTGGTGTLESPLTVSSGSYTVTVGAGAPTAVNNIGNRGSNSVFSTITSLGGGGGGCASSPTSGGSGGGGGEFGGTYLGAAGTAGQGFDGGNGLFSGNNCGGPGGGAGARGTDTTGAAVGPGGIGRVSAISGTSIYYAGGGGASGNGLPGSAGGLGGGGNGGAGCCGGSGTVTAGSPNTGGGGGGTYQANANTVGGGSGILIIRYRTA